MKQEEIARKLNISVATVSRTLNRDTRHMVKDETRERVMAYVRKVGYKPNLKARGLVKGHMGNITLLFTTGVISAFYDDYLPKIVKGLARALSGTDHGISILPIEKGLSRDRIYETVMDHETSGMMLLPYCKHSEFPLELMNGFSFPIVSVDHRISGRNSYNLLFDHAGAGRLGAEYLIGKGCEKLALVSDINHAAHSELRKKGFLEYLRENDAMSRFLGLVEVPFTYSSLPQVMDALRGMRLDGRRMGIFSLNDEIAIALADHVHELNLSFPGQVSILGFDGLQAGQFHVPRLSSVTFSIEEAGERAARSIMNRLNGKRVAKTTFMKAFVMEGETA